MGIVYVMKSVTLTSDTVILSVMILPFRNRTKHNLKYFSSGYLLNKTKKTKNSLLLLLVCVFL